MTIDFTNPNLQSTNVFSFTGTETGATSDATLEVRTFGDIDGTGGNEEMWTITDEDGGTTGAIGATGDFADQCNTTLLETFTIPAALIDAWAADGQIDFTGTDVAGNINTVLCGGDFLELRLVYDYLQAGPPAPYTVITGFPSGGVFPVGTTLTTLEYVDAGGNAVQCTFNVTVNDIEAPVIACIGEPGVFNLVEDFDAGLPAGWSTVINTGTCDWLNIADLPIGPDFATPGMVFDDDDCGLGAPPSNATLLSDVYDLSGSTTATLGYDVAFIELGAGEYFLVEVWDGAAWQQVANYVTDIDPILTESIDVTAYINANFQVRWTYDDGGVWAWHGGIDNFTLDYDVPGGSAYDVILDANGMATVDMSNLILNATDNCGNVTVTTVGVPPVTEILPTTFAGGNGQSGNMFDVMAINELTINSFDVNMDTGVTDDVEIYFKTGSYAGFQQDPAAWTLLATVPGVTSAGEGLPTPLNQSLGVVVAAGETVAFYVTLTTSTGINYTNGSTTGALFASDANLEFYEGDGNAYPFGGNFSPRVFNGNIVYSVGQGASTTIDFDCSQVGENLVEVMVTDASGNSSICTATVNVIDDTAPIITCVGPTTPIEVGTASDSPGTVIVDNSTVTTTLEVTEDVTIMDLNVDMNITHTWVGDLQITLESPSGTQALIFDGGADGCSGDNINDIYDDESANALACQAGSGDAFPEADYMPSNPLSVFDGESTLGTWTLSVEDTAGGDAGTIDTWGIIYEYEGTPTAAFPIILDENGQATVDPLDLIADTIEACGIATAAADITEFDCSDIGGIILVTVFVELTCPADQTVDPGAGSLFYEVPDYFATGEATATDNCTDPVVNTTQDPPAGTLLADGVYTVTCTATDDSGNVATCEFELTVESVLGVDDNALDIAIAMYPNPAMNQVTISNSSSIVLEKAAIYDVNGKLVMNVNLQDMQGEKVIDISQLASGVYMVQISGEQASVVKRLIKE
jgi:subtilisin-like proprotein convertase family protein